MCMTLALSKMYSRDFFIASKDASLLQQAAVKLMVPFMIPKILMNTKFARQDVNCITKRKLGKEMTGIVNVTSQKPIGLDAIKEASKKLGVTINDMVLCALTTSLKVIFKE